MEKLISVIIPLFNAEQTILRCLTSLKEQSNNNIEVIIVNDGSTDGSSNLVEKYIQENKLNEWQLFSTLNRGVANARNFGISRAKGEYLCFVDADDYVEKDYIEKLLSVMQQYNCDLCISSYYKVIYKKGKKNVQNCLLLDKFYPNISSLSSSGNLFIDGFMHPCWGKLYKTRIIRDNQVMFPNQSLSEDTVFNLKYLNYINSIKTIEYPLYNYIINLDSHSLSKSFPLDIFHIYISIHRDYVAFFQKHSLDITIIEKMMYAQYYSAMIKVFFSKSLSYRRKKCILDDVISIKEIKNSFLIRQENTILLFINKLIYHKFYLCAKFILQLSVLKEKFMK